VFLTATTYVGAVYDAASRLLANDQPRIGVDDVLIPVVAECDPSAYCDVQGAGALNLLGFRASPPVERSTIRPAGQTGGLEVSTRPGAIQWYR
jgi:hypothetical protein